MRFQRAKRCRQNKIHSRSDSAVPSTLNSLTNQQNNFFREKTEKQLYFYVFHCYLQNHQSFTFLQANNPFKLTEQIGNFEIRVTSKTKTKNRTIKHDWKKGEEEKDERTIRT